MIHICRSLTFTKTSPMLIHRKKNKLKNLNQNRNQPGSLMMMMMGRCIFIQKSSFIYFQKYGCGRCLGRNMTKIQFFFHHQNDDDTRYLHLQCSTSFLTFIHFESFIVDQYQFIDWLQIIIIIIIEIKIKKTRNLKKIFKLGNHVTKSLTQK